MARWGKYKGKSIKDKHYPVNPGRVVGPSMLVLKEYRERARGLGTNIDYIERLHDLFEKSLPPNFYLRLNPASLEKQKGIQPKLIRKDDAKYPDYIDREGRKYVWRDAMHPRLRVIKVLQEWQSSHSKGGMVEFNRIRVYRAHEFHIDMFFAGTKAFFQRFDVATQTVRTSIVYSTDRAREIMQERNWRRVYWVKSVVLPIPEDIGSE